MDDQKMQKILNDARAYKKEGKFTKALELYDEVYNHLIKEAADYARSFEGPGIDNGDTRKVMPQFFNKADEYLKRDNRACTILNNMGVIFAEIGDKETAKKYFNESIKYIPDGLNYQNPHTSLENL